MLEQKCLLLEASALDQAGRRETSLGSEVGEGGAGDPRAWNSFGNGGGGGEAKKSLLGGGGGSYGGAGRTRSGNGPTLA